VREVRDLLRRSADFNHRQLALLGNALKHPDRQYTVQSHRISHNVAYETARNDLLELHKRQLLRMTRVGRTFVYVAPHDLGDRIAGR